MARGLHHLDDAIDSEAPGTASSDPTARLPLARALARTTGDAAGPEGTFLSRRSRLLAIGAALEMRIGAAGYDATLRACEALIAGRPKPPRAKPTPPNQLELPLAAGAAPTPAPFRTRPARRRWR